MAFGKFAKYTPDEIAYNPIRFDLVKELRNCFDYVAKEDANQHRMAFESPVTSLAIVSDPRHIQYIAINLLQNAVKYSPAGTTVKLSLQTAPGPIRFSVADEGIEQLYSPFFRANNVAGRPGTGLGLAILKRSAKTLSATVEVATELDRGTTFTITLPAA